MVNPPPQPPVYAKCYVCGNPMDGLSEDDCHCFHRKELAPPPQLQEDGPTDAQLWALWDRLPVKTPLTLARAALAATRTAAAPDLMAAIDVPYMKRLIAELQENGDPISIDAADEFQRLAEMVSASTAAPVARADEQSSVHPAAPSSPSALRAAPLQSPCALDRSELPVRPSE